MGLFHLLMAAFAIYRMTVRESLPNEAQSPFVVIPQRSTPMATQLLPDAPWEGGSSEDEGTDDDHSNTNDNSLSSVS